MTDNGTYRRLSNNVQEQMGMILTNISKLEILKYLCLTLYFKHRFRLRKLTFQEENSQLENNKENIKNF